MSLYLRILDKFLFIIFRRFSKFFIYLKVTNITPLKVYNNFNCDSTEYLKLKLDAPRQNLTVNILILFGFWFVSLNTI